MSSLPHPVPPRRDDFNSFCGPCPVDYLASHKHLVRLILEQSIPVVVNGGTACSDVETYLSVNQVTDPATINNINLLDNLLTNERSEIIDFIYSKLHHNTIAVLEALLNERNLQTETIIKTCFSILTGLLAYAFDRQPESSILRSCLSRYHYHTAGLIDFEVGNGYSLTLINHLYIPACDAHDTRVPLHELPIMCVPESVLGVDRCFRALPALIILEDDSADTLDPELDQFTSSVDSGVADMDTPSASP